MKSAPCFVGLFFGVVASCIGQDGITGTWKAEEVAFAPWTFTLKAEGAKVTGTVSQGGSSGTTTTTLTGATAIYNGTIEGNKVSFKCDSPDGGRTIAFSGVMASNVIAFTREVKVQPGAFPGMNGIYGASGASHFRAKRVPVSTTEAAPRLSRAAAGPARAQSTELPVPNIADVTRVDRDTPPSQQDGITATYILKTSPHATVGDAYVIVTDETEAAYLDPLERLARFHHGAIVRVKDLGALRTAAGERDQLISDLRRARPRFVAIAPKSGSFTGNMLLGIWSALAGLSDDQRVPVFPGILAAPSQTAFNSLVDRSINYRPQAAAQLRPFVMGQVLGPRPFGQRSLQKVRMMRNLFADYGCTTHSLVILASTAVQMGVTIPPATNQWQVAMSGTGPSIKTIPSAARPALDDASLLLMFGHGTRGTACSLDVSAFHDVPMTGKIVMCGDCFSAASAQTGIWPATDGPGDKPLQQKDESFAMRAVENGAAVVYAHMRENAGFPHLFPVMEAWMEGLTVGEAYQRLINALIAFSGTSADDLVSRDVVKSNTLLYVIIGDPALQPLAKMTLATPRPSGP
jgi:hypothetical protein